MVNGSKMSWLEMLTLKRHANASNVFVLETDDPERLEQLRKTVRALFCENCLENGYLLSLQTGKVTTLWGSPAPSTAQGAAAMHWLLEKASREPTLVIIAWVVTPEHVKRLLDPLLYASQAPEIYRPVPSAEVGSTFIAMTFSLSLWPSEALRFFVAIEVEPSNPEERRQLLEKILRLAERRGYQVEANVSEAVAAGAGLTLHDFTTATIEAIRLKRPVNAATYRSYKQELLKRLGLEYVEPKRGFESVGGYDYLKNWLRVNVISFYRHPEIVKKYGLTPPRGLLFFGPPGTGKTWLAKALAKEMGLPMVKLSASDILRGIVGESERRARKIAQIVESMAPIVVFIDEADQLFRSRASTLATDSGVSQRVQNILLDWLGDEDRKSFIVMATNYLEQFDFAAVRAGRIDYAVPVLLPDREARKEIVKLHMEVLAKPSVPVKVEYDSIADMTVGFSGAELAQVARQAKVLAAIQQAESIEQSHLLEAVKLMSIDVEKRQSLVARMLEEAEKVETVVVPRDLLAKARSVLEEFKHGESVFDRF